MLQVVQACRIERIPEDTLLICRYLRAGCLKTSRHDQELLHTWHITVYPLEPGPHTATLSTKATSTIKVGAGAGARLLHCRQVLSYTPWD